MDEKKYTPIMQQYLGIKKKHEGYLVFFRLGDFYEMFFEDAKIAAGELDLVLTSREGGSGERVAMCGVPHHAVDGYLSRLVAKGYKIVICEQMEDASAAVGGLIKRDVVRIVTPGTLTQSEMLAENSNNYIAGIYAGEKQCGLAAADVSTGSFYLTGFDGVDMLDHLLNELGAYTPAEVIFNDDLSIYPKLNTYLRDRISSSVSDRQEMRFELNKASSALTDQFLKSAQELGLEGKDDMIRAAGGLLDYLYETQKTDLSYIRTINVYDGQKYMCIDINTRRNLELCRTMRGNEKKGSLLWVLDRTKSAMGARTLKKWIEQPLTNCYEIQQRQEAVRSLFKDMIERGKLMNALGELSDIERIMTRVAYTSANCKDLLALGASIAKYPLIRSIISPFDCAALKEIHAKLGGLEGVAQLISEAIEDDPPHSVREGGMIRTSFNADVARLREVMRDGKSWITRIETSEREATGIKTLKVSYNRVFGYYIEVTKSNLTQIPDRYIRKQTLANCERFITQELKEMEAEILSATDKLRTIEYDIFMKLLHVIVQKIAEIQVSADAIAKLDALCSLAEAAVKNNYTAPEVDYSDVLDLKDARHPVVEKLLEDSMFVPNDTLLDCDDNMLCIVTGPNMAGKSTYMRQIALITIMAQIGSFVPAKSARVGIVDQVFTRIGASDDLTSGQSTFMLEMNEVAYILDNATKKSLIIYDEIGRGTSTYDGMSIARAIVEYTASKKLGARTVFATHYHELTELEGQISGVKNYNITVKKRGDELIFLRKIVRGGADDSYGIEVAILAGLPGEVIKRSKDILRSLEEHTDVKSPQIKPKIQEKQDEMDNVSFDDLRNEEIAERIGKLDLNILTPIEAMNILYELNKLVKS